MDWARSNHFVVFTHDLDFGTILAVTSAAGPSVIQVRARDLLPSHIGGVVVAAIRQYEDLLTAGALITVDKFLPEPEFSLSAREFLPPSRTRVSEATPGHCLTYDKWTPR